ncbi:hypothetical protein LEP1GSC043_0383 [Leptospira weilii str. Ecochallenge]|uniref:Uncharacterized protein n=2 Tax=Leptospira weilii TaxID=28184 RepID=N1UBS9_9LEPT|nr:hypothetical protein LEP1GSC051_2276 [Leptospira sp. P2653]EMN92487.1 hypothetical protein LEP1GSC108_0289 [Leptospira weilii str. UI 13098]EMY15671.1 hypothetical protein LEP1GSC043_0383 [Leptospira weilii str. Ecochallenge]
MSQNVGTIAVIAGILIRSNGFGTDRILSLKTIQHNVFLNSNLAPEGS